MEANYVCYFVQIIEPLGETEEDRAWAHFEDATLRLLLPVSMQQFIHI